MDRDNLSGPEMFLFVMIGLLLGGVMAWYLMVLRTWVQEKLEERKRKKKNSEYRESESPDIDEVSEERRTVDQDIARKDFATQSDVEYEQENILDAESGLKDMNAPIVSRPTTRRQFSGLLRENTDDDQLCSSPPRFSSLPLSKLGLSPSLSTRGWQEFPLEREILQLPSEAEKTPGELESPGNEETTWRMDVGFKNDPSRPCARNSIILNVSGIPSCE